MIFHFLTFKKNFPDLIFCSFICFSFFFHRITKQVCKLLSCLQLFLKRSPSLFFKFLKPMVRKYLALEILIKLTNANWVSCIILIIQRTKLTQGKVINTYGFLLCTSTEFYTEQHRAKRFRHNRQEKPDTKKDYLQGVGILVDVRNCQAKQDQIALQLQVTLLLLVV